MANNEQLSFPESRRELYLEKPLPSSPDAEKVILGAILLDNDIIDAAMLLLIPGDFYNPFNRRVFASMSLLREKSKQIDPITIGEEMKKEGSIESIGGVSAITSLTFGLPHFSSVDDYIEIVKSNSQLRELIRACNEITTAAVSGEQEASMVMDFAESKIYSLTVHSTVSDFVQVSEPVDSSIALAHQRAEQDDVVTGLHTGYFDLDTKLQGLHKGHQTILAARPGVGKSALMMGIAQNLTLRHGGAAAIFSLEMSKEELMDRLICSECGIDGYRYKSGQLSQVEWDRVEECREFVATKHLYIDDTPSMTVSLMRSKLRRLQSSIDVPLDLVAVDYLQLMGGDDPRNREREVAKTSRDMKVMSREFDVAALALSQMNRQSENRTNHRPVMADLRESGAIEQDASVVAFIYREDLYQEVPSLHTNIAEIIIAKNRHGATGVVNLGYNGPHTKFTNLSQEQAAF